MWNMFKDIITNSKDIIANLEQISRIVLMFVLFTLKK